MVPATTEVSARFLEALDFAVRLHRNDFRKGTQIPYVAHLLAVCALVLYHGGREDEAIAALLHDALEDHADKVSPEEIAARFGENVLAIVRECSDTPEDYSGGAKPPWAERKAAYVERLKSARGNALRVSLADKLDNARSLLADYRQVGDALWSRFNAGKEEQLRYYRSLVQAFREAGESGFLIEELDRVVTELVRLSAADAAGR